MPPSETHPYCPHGSPLKMRRFRLMGPGEGHHMDIGDAVACQNLEVFEASHENVADYEAASAAAGESVVMGQVGIRCIHCLPGSAYNTFYPPAIGEMAACIQVAADRHLSICPAAPAQVREPCEQAAAKRRRDHEQRRAPSHDEERQHLALVDHCRFFCGNVGLVDKYPPKSGVFFRDVSSYRSVDMHQPTPEQYSQINEQSSNTIRTPLPPVMGTPFQPPPSRGPVMDNITATPLARRSKQHGQDREYHSTGGRRDYMPPPSVDRRDYQPPGSEREAYHAFMPHLSRGPYPPDIPQERTPAPQRRPEEAPDPTHQGTPQVLLPESPHAYRQPPTPYDIPPHNNFPYFQDLNGSWVCCYCSHIHPQYRDQGAIWSSQNLSPPPAQVIDQHLSICRSYNQGLSSSYYEAPPPPYNYGHHSNKYGGQYHPGTAPAWGPPGGSSGYLNDSPYPYLAPSIDQSALPYATPALEGTREPSSQRSSRAIPTRGRPGILTEATDHEMLKAVEVLLASDKRHFGTDFREREQRGQLVLEEDKLLLTDYFYHLMRQLRLCRFSESDRKTRGGKRENIAVGYGGLQCVHCSDAPNSRKFFWSNVDRLANSFAEIPAHVLKCRRCPNPVKTSLMDLKRRHPEQMARLPRGSQKVFFRRMWRRLHDEDPEPQDRSKSTSSKANEENVAPVSKGSSGSKTTLKSESSQGESTGNYSKESSFLVERSTPDAAKALADSVLSRSTPTSPSERVLLAISDDKEWLSDMDCFIRRNLEVFCASEEDVEIAQQDRKYPVNVGQVGIRCVHCALAKGGNTARGTAVAFPYSINGIYESVREFQRLHLEGCPHLPESAKKKLAGFKGSASLSSVLRKYYVLAAKALGMHDTPDGISSGGECVPLGSSAASAFSFPDTVQETRTSGELQSRNSEEGFLQGAVTPLESRKRKTAIANESMPLSTSSKKSKDESKETPLSNKD
eukprot:CAMPEP_0194158768 /NCGR_PEP_ID=MMETSP0152-20130528/77453_1 /TAXON_ID=1049557 /ORGANISM="Thalassiothrix antarctica, Strain L6-D1" /LENGTH=959 /DNA_ID=CAMNT_0038868257 /DNA_START=444 /DNA_END=3323 /DNA_ORIENTATION=+